MSQPKIHPSQVGSTAIKQVVSSVIGPTTGTATRAINNVTPLITDGVEVATCTITLNSDQSRVLYTTSANVDTNTNNRNIIFMIFRDNICIGASQLYCANANTVESISRSRYDFPNVTGPVTYSIRVAADAATTWYINTNTGGNTFGGLMNTSIILEEILPE